MLQHLTKETGLLHDKNAFVTLCKGINRNISHSSHRGYYTSYTILIWCEKDVAITVSLTSCKLPSFMSETKVVRCILIQKSSQLVKVLP